MQPLPPPNDSRFRIMTQTTFFFFGFFFTMSRVDNERTRAKRNMFEALI